MRRGRRHVLWGCAVGLPCIDVRWPPSMEVIRLHAMHWELIPHVRRAPMGSVVKAGNWPWRGALARMLTRRLIKDRLDGPCRLLHSFVLVVSPVFVARGRNRGMRHKIARFGPGSKVAKCPFLLFRRALSRFADPIGQRRPSPAPRRKLRIFSAVSRSLFVRGSIPVGRRGAVSSPSTRPIVV